ncbi:DUF1906 domain-containing protein [Actinocrispum wychmicini]|uniref:Uncharacterized protein DUF1906 n=1 Tax=Actinocrispum wychmicini TaxID=1213861 RepID=A0A4R2KD30_9PSEU|nr:DUF1906 domain-containing protein [Actinocrispum wychmicini]TCO64415.1 uncharacterized protein DUF1906 [Actinocrispum wychmicini]
MRAWIAGTGAVTLLAALVVPAEATEQTVDYRGYSLKVPVDWPVIDLTTRPTECVRFDRNAVYLGEPGADQRCPASVRQVTDAVLIEPDGTVTVTGEKYASLRTRIATTRAEPAHHTVQPGVYTGPGFDACSAPSQGTMDAWLGSPYRAIGVYIGGIHRACAQPNLTAGWVNTQARKGWHLIPIYVGRQATCTSFRYRVDPDQGVARDQGRDAANDAVDLAKPLGLAAGTVIYDDMEAYNTADGGCSAAVMSFFSGWSEQLRNRGYRPGVYSSAGAGITDLVRNFDNGGYNRPDHVWFAWWNNQANADGGRFLPDDRWAGQRIHQYQGGHDESYNGVGVNIDSNFLDITG